MKRIYWSIVLIITSCMTCIAQINPSNQITPSVYVGYGMGTNLGGMLGVGTEFQYRQFAGNLAIGQARSKFDYDFGIKYYTKINLYAGINYGLIESEKINDEVVKTRGFSFTAGYKQQLFKSIYASAYLGLTSKKQVNRYELFDSNAFIPRIGIMLGYRFHSFN